MGDLKDEVRKRVESWEGFQSIQQMGKKVDHGPVYVAKVETSAPMTSEEMKTVEGSLSVNMGGGKGYVTEIGRSEEYCAGCNKAGLKAFKHCICPRCSSNLLYCTEPCQASHWKMHRKSAFCK